MVNAAVLKKANLILHGVQGVWSVVIMGVIATGMTQSGPASGAARFIFTMVSLGGGRDVWDVGAD